jgi:hypothetical protein
VFLKENVHASEHDAYFQGGERGHLLRLLLNRMVAPEDGRIPSMKEVVSGLTQIKEWANNAQTIAAGEESRQKILGLRSKIQGADRERREALEAKEKLDAIIAATRSSVSAFLRHELEKVAPLFGDGGDLHVAVATETSELRIQFENAPRWRALEVVEMAVRQPSYWTGKRALQLWICLEERFAVTVNESKGSGQARAASAPPPKVSLIPIVARSSVEERRLIFSVFANDTPLELKGDEGVLRLDRTSTRIRVAQAGGNLTIDGVTFPLPEWPSVSSSLVPWIGKNIGRFSTFLGTLIRA